MSIADKDPEPEVDVEIERSDKKERSEKDSWSVSGDTITRHHEEPQLKLCEQDDETFLIPLTCRSDETNKDIFLTMFQNT